MWPLNGVLHGRLLGGQQSCECRVEQAGVVAASTQVGPDGLPALGPPARYLGEQAQLRRDDGHSATFNLEDVEVLPRGAVDALTDLSVAQRSLNSAELETHIR